MQTERCHGVDAERTVRSGGAGLGEAGLGRAGCGGAGRDRVPRAWPRWLAGALLALGLPGLLGAEVATALGTNGPAGWENATWGMEETGPWEPTRSVDIEASERDPELGQRAQLRARHATTLAAGLSGRIAELPFDIGERVERGATVAAFDCGEERARREIAAARLEAAQATREVKERLAELGNGSGLEVDVARAEARMAAAQLREAESVIAKCRVEAPFDGIVVERPARAHQYVAEGEPLLMLIDTEALEVDMVLPSDWLGWLRPGVGFSFAVRETGEEVPGQVDRIVGAVDPVSQTVRVIGTLAGGTAGLLPGMSGGVRLERPAAALSEGAGQR